MKEFSGLAKVGYFCIGLFGGLPGVLVAWLVGHDGWGWSEGGKKFAWFGCLFFFVVAIVFSLTGGLMALIAVMTGNATVTVS